MTTTMVDAEWDDETRQLAVAATAVDDARCPRCGGPAEDCQGGDADGAFDVPPPTRCQRMTAVERAAAPYFAADSGTAQPSALIFDAIRRGTTNDDP